MSKKLSRKHIISAAQFSPDDLAEIFELTDHIVDYEKRYKKYPQVLGDIIVATLFYEPSTRTRLSFESAANRVGASVISTENAKIASSAVKGEDLSDTIQVIDDYADVIVIRHPANDSAEIAASVSDVPIINAGSGGGEHPTQALLDMYTIRQMKGGFDHLKVAVSGDLLKGRTIHSLIEMLSLYKDVTIFGLSHESLQLPPEYVEFMKMRGVNFIPCTEFTDLPPDTDIIYHTRTQLERLNGAADGIEEYIITPKVMRRFSPETYIMHPLPRVAEIAKSVDSDPRAIYFQQAHNGVPVRAALLMGVLGRTSLLEK